MAKFTYLVLHCSDTPEGKYFDKQDILLWHTGPPPNNNWSRPGYTDVILLNGTVQNLTPFDQDDDINWKTEATFGVKGYNTISRHICYIGGRTKDFKHFKDTRTREQLRVMEIYVKYMLARHPQIKVVGHRQLDPKKACPSFDVPTWCRYIGIDPKHIYLG